MAHGVVAITIDLLPAWILPPYGATWVSAPTLNTLSARGIVFDRVVAEVADPVAVAREMVPVPQGGRLDLVTDDDRLAALVHTGSASAATGTPAEPIHGSEGPARGTRGGPLALFSRAAQVASLPGAAGTLWCHLTSLGRAWSAPPSYRERYRDPEDPPGLGGTGVPRMAVDAATDPDALAAIRHAFAGEVTYLDECLGGLLAAVDAAAGGQPPLVLVAGVRGMPLGLHGWAGPPEAASGFVPAYGEVVDLPVIVVDPKGRMAAQRFGGLVCPRDVAAAVEDVLGGDPNGPAESPGGGLRGLFSAWLAPSCGPDRGSSRSPREAVVGLFAGGRSVTTAEWRLILRSRPESVGQGPAAELYAKPDDYFETNNVADRCPEVVESLRRRAGC